LLAAGSHLSALSRRDYWIGDGSSWTASYRQCHG
jgi:hypothetical protein